VHYISLVIVTGVARTVESPSYIIVSPRRVLSRRRLLHIVAFIWFIGLITSVIEVLQPGSIDLTRVFTYFTVGGIVSEVLSMIHTRRKLARAREKLETTTSRYNHQLAVLALENLLLGLHEILEVVSPRKWGLIVHGRGEYTVIAECRGGYYVVASMRGISSGWLNLVSTTIHLTGVYQVTNIGGPLVPGGRRLRRIMNEGFVFVEKPRLVGTRRLEIALPSTGSWIMPKKEKVSILIRIGTLVLRSPENPDEVVIGGGVLAEARVYNTIDYLDGFEHLVKSLLEASIRAIEN